MLKKARLKPGLFRSEHRSKKWTPVFRRNDAKTKDYTSAARTV
jgi:hypothetical protein